MCSETVPEIGGGGGNWKGPPADSSEVVRWHSHGGEIRGGFEDLK